MGPIRIQCLEEHFSRVDAWTWSSWFVMMVYVLTTIPYSPPVSDNLTFWMLFFARSLAKSSNPHPPIIRFLPSWAPPKQGKRGARPPWSSSPPALVTSRSASPPEPRSRALMGPSKPGKTAWGLEREPGKLACSCCRMNGKTDGKRETHWAWHLNKSLNLIFCVQNLFY